MRNCNVLVPVRLHFLMSSFSAGNFWFKLFPCSHQISGNCNNEIPHKKSSISCMIDYLYTPCLLLCKSKHSENTSLVLHITFCICDVPSKIISVDISLKYKRDFFNGNDKTKNSNNFMADYRRKSVLSVIT